MGDKFEWFSADEPDPIGKYKQPVSNDVALPPGSGYPEKDVDKDGVFVKGKMPAGTGMKTRIDIRGTGAATKGKQMTLDPDAGD